MKLEINFQLFEKMKLEIIFQLFENTFENTKGDGLMNSSDNKVHQIM